MSRSSSGSGNGSMNFKRRSRSHSIGESSSRGSFSGGEVSLKKGPWTAPEDEILKEYVRKHGGGNWNAVQKHTGLRRCGKSCRLRWTNHLRPNLKKCPFSAEEERLIAELHAKWGNKWAKIASYLPGRTDNEIKNYWNTRSKRCQRAGLPLYPSDIIKSQPTVKEESQFPKHENQDSGHDSMFDNFEPNAESMSCAPPFSHLTFGSLLNQGGGYQINSFITQSGNSDPLFPLCDGDFNYRVPGQDQLTSPELLYRPFSWQLTYNLDRGGGTTGLTPMVNYSASQAPLVTAKTELPSLQLHEPRFGQTSTPEDVDFYADSPLMAEVSECASSRTNGLLDDMILKANARTTGNFNVNAYFTEVVSLNSPVSTLTGSASSFNESSAGKHSVGSITPENIEEAQIDGGGANGLPQSGENVDMDFLSKGVLDYVNDNMQFESWDFDQI